MAPTSMNAERRPPLRRAPGRGDGCSCPLCPRTQAGTPRRLSPPGRTPWAPAAAAGSPAWPGLPPASPGKDGMNCPLSDAGFGLGGLLARGFPRPSPSSPPFCFPGGHFHVEPGQFGEQRGATFLWVPSGSRAEPQGLTHIHTHRRADTQTHTHREACSPRFPKSRAPDTACPPWGSPAAHPHIHPRPRQPPAGTHPYIAPSQTHAVPAPASHGGRGSAFPHPPEPPLLPGHLPLRPRARPPSCRALPSRRRAPRFPSRAFPGKGKTPHPTCHGGRAARLSRSCRPLTPLGVPRAFAAPRPRCLRGPPRSAHSTAGSAVSPECIPHVASIKDFCHAILRLTDFRCFGCGLRKGDLLLQENRGGGSGVWEPPLLAFSHLSDCLQ
ncbi:uncharacterized protein LOC113460621 isoform X1 [Zonotrichia albicollis]|uniref:uncharacterized protein LOC113460621 isoform X1 n=1 Tax=Zonotrichia albicollis TaxID=44394 RepID=UPI003D810267